MLKALFIISALLLSACQGFIYRMDIPQGNFLTQKEVEKLRIDMTKEQVAYVLGNSILPDTFNDDTWYYVYKMKQGMTGDSFSRSLVLSFKDGRLAEVSGDFKTGEEFDTPLTE